MLRLLLSAAIACIAGTGTVHAQTVEETYAALCGNGQRSETCDALGQVLAERGTGPSSQVPDASMDPAMQRWGVMARLVGTTWAVEKAGKPYLLAFTWLEPGSSLQEEWRPAGDIIPEWTYVTRMQFHESSGTVRAKGLEGTKAKWTGHIDANGNVEFRATSFLARGHVYRYFLRDGALVYEEGGVSGLVKAPFVEQVLVSLDPQAEQQYIARAKAAQWRIVNDEKAAERARDAQWSATMGALNGALDAALPIAHERAAQSQYELDATLAELNARAAAGTTPIEAPAMPRIPEGASMPRTPSPSPSPSSSPAPARQCRTVDKTFTKSSIPLPTRALAETHVRSGLAGACAIGSTATVGAISCSEDSEPVWGEDERGVPKVTGRRPVFACSATITCSPVEVCDSTPGGGASAQ